MFDKISVMALEVLKKYHPTPLTTRFIANEIARDKEFTGDVLEFLMKRGLVDKVLKDEHGQLYKRWMYWSLTANSVEGYTKLGAFM